MINRTNKRVGKKLVLTTRSKELAEFTFKLGIPILIISIIVVIILSLRSSYLYWVLVR